MTTIAPLIMPDDSSRSAPRSSARGLDVAPQRASGRVEDSTAAVASAPRGIHLPLFFSGADTAFRELAPGVKTTAAGWGGPAPKILTPEAVNLVAALHRELEPERGHMLLARAARQREWDSGSLPGFLEGDVAAAARGAWRVAQLPPDILKRRVEITGPVNSPKMVIQMLSRGEDGARADAAMLDFEDSMKPDWENMLQGVENVRAAAEGTLAWTRPAEGGKPEKTYRLDSEDMPLLMVRCRGLHLDECNFRVDNEPVSGGLFDLALSALHSARALLARGRTPMYYVPKCEHHLEARWWDRLFTRLEEALLLRVGTLRVTLLIETLPAAFQLEEILWETRGRAAGLNVGRWDKIFSDIKALGNHPDRVLADRGTIGLESPWMRAYAERLIQVCHRHGAFAMGGMAAFTPGKSEERRKVQTDKVLADKRFEASLGHDGCWVSHPFFIGPALSAFPRDNQLDISPELPESPDLLPRGGGPYTLAGLRKNLRVGIAYLKGWNEGLGCVAWDDLMEDLATLEISRAQTWQWLRHQVTLDDGSRVTRELVVKIFAEELARIDAELRDAMKARPAAEAEAEITRYTLAAKDAQAIFTEKELRPFLTNQSEIAGTRSE